MESGGRRVLDPSLFCAEFSALRTADVSCWKAEIEKTISQGTHSSAHEESSGWTAWLCLQNSKCGGKLNCGGKKIIHVELETPRASGKGRKSDSAAGLRSSRPPLHNGTAPRFRAQAVDTDGWHKRPHKYTRHAHAAPAPCA